MVALLEERLIVSGYLEIADYFIYQTIWGLSARQKCIH
jgi:hypothetical protein